MIYTNSYRTREKHVKTKLIGCNVLSYPCTLGSCPVRFLNYQLLILSLMNKNTELSTCWKSDWLTFKGKKSFLSLYSLLRYNPISIHKLSSDWMSYLTIPFFTAFYASQKVMNFPPSRKRGDLNGENACISLKMLKTLLAIFE